MTDLHTQIQLDPAATRSPGTLRPIRARLAVISEEPAMNYDAVASRTPARSLEPLVRAARHGQARRPPAATATRARRGETLAQTPALESCRVTPRQTTPNEIALTHQRVPRLGARPTQTEVIR